jgi:hypothetical protein
MMLESFRIDIIHQRMGYVCFMRVVEKGVELCQSSIGPYFFALHLGHLEAVLLLRLTLTERPEI